MGATGLGHRAQLLTPLCQALWQPTDEVELRACLYFKQHTDSDGDFLDTGEPLQPPSSLQQQAEPEGDAEETEEEASGKEEEQAVGKNSLEELTGSDSSEKETGPEEEEGPVGEEQVVDLASCLLAALHCWHS